MAVRVLPHEGMPPGIMDVRRPVGIEIVFRVLRAGKPLFPKIKVLDRESTIAFNAMDTDERWLEPTPPGEYAATAWIPGNLLNEGAVSVGGRDLLASTSRSSSITPRSTRRSRSRCSTRARATRPAAGSAGSGAASCGRCSSGA